MNNEFDLSVNQDTFTIVLYHSHSDSFPLCWEAPTLDYSVPLVHSFPVGQALSFPRNYHIKIFDCSSDNVKFPKLFDDRDGLSLTLVVQQFIILFLLLSVPFVIIYAAGNFMYSGRTIKKNLEEKIKSE